jgi:hypothetical protein
VAFRVVPSYMEKKGICTVLERVEMKNLMIRKPKVSTIYGMM